MLEQELVFNAVESSIKIKQMANGMTTITAGVNTRETKVKVGTHGC
jgi:hypothetical protein